MADGKGVETRVGTVPVGTAPDAVPADLLDELTLREARELREYLFREQVELARARLAALPAQLLEAARLVNVDTLDSSAAESVAAAASSLLSSVRRVQRGRKPGAELPAQPAG